MGSRHLDINLEDLRAEQENINRIIDSLLIFNPATSSSSSPRRNGDSENTNSPTPVRGRGRQRGTTTRANASTRTPSSPSPVVPETASLLSVIQCMNKLNEQNKRLLDFVGVISEKLESVPDPDSDPNRASVVQSGVNEVSQQQAINSVNDRLEKIEQNINSNTLVVRGPAVEGLIKDCATGEVPNLDRLKGDICRTACGEDVTAIDITSMRVSVFGREKKSVKIDCHNANSKLLIIKQTRSRKPEGFYVSEFLTTAKLKVFHNLRVLKKQYPQKIKAVFTRGGNVFYTLHDSNRVHQVSSLSDIAGIIDTNPSQETSSAA